MESLLKGLLKAIKPAVTDSRRKIASPAFSTFFNDIAFAPYVNALLTNVTTGVALHDQGSPVFFCVTAPGQLGFTDLDTMKQEDMYMQCLNNPYGLMNIMHGLPYITVCPLFFDKPDLRDYPPKNACAKMMRNGNRFADRQGAFILYRMWIFLEEIAHYYITMTTGARIDVYDINACSRLLGKLASQNPGNYRFYAASIFGKCTEFPRKSTRPNEVELLGNSTGRATPTDAIWNDTIT